METINLCKKDLSHPLFENILFFMYAEVGAMGERGAVQFVKTDGRLYRFNYLFDDIRERDLVSYFPMPGFLSQGRTGWQYVSLGCGNHLLVRDAVYPQFHQLIKDYTRKGEIYRDWISHAETVVKGVVTNG